MTTIDQPRIGEFESAPVPVALGLRETRLRAAHAPVGWGQALRSILPVAVPSALGLLALWFLLFATVLTGFQEHAGQTRLYDRYRLQLAQETAPLAEPVKVGSPVAMIDAPSAGLHKLIVVEGTTSRLLQRGPGHLSDTVLPGQVGDSVLLGRSLTYGGPFREVTAMKAGTQLTVTTGQGVFGYQIEDVRSKGDLLPPPLRPGQSRLTLVTSAGSGWTSGWAPTRTVFVDALLIGGHAQPVPAGVPASVSNAALPMQEDPSGLVALIFWLEAVVAAVVVLFWSWFRWGRAQTWVVGAPIVFVALWGAGDALMRFLPNLL